jgi:hypothetical protein
LASIHRKQKHRKFLTPLDWPGWTDEDRWGLGPDPDDAGPYEGPTQADREWAAEHLNEDSDRLFEDEEALEQAALEAQALDRLQRGYCP